MITFTPEQRTKILTEYYNRKAQIEATNKEANKPLENFHAIMARNKPHIGTTHKPHTCNKCGAQIPAETKAWITPSRIAARSSRCTDATFTGPRYTCLNCVSEANQP